MNELGELYRKLQYGAEAIQGEISQSIGNSDIDGRREAIVSKVNSLKDLIGNILEKGGNKEEILGVFYGPPPIINLTDLDLDIIDHRALKGLIESLIENKGGGRRRHSSKRRHSKRRSSGRRPRRSKRRSSGKKRRHRKGSCANKRKSRSCRRSKRCTWAKGRKGSRGHCRRSKNRK